MDLPAEIIAELIRDVDAGEDWLNRHKPTWFEIVDPPYLNMRDGSKCVLGQVYQADVAALAEEDEETVYQYQVEEDSREYYAYDWALDNLDDGLIAEDMGFNLPRSVRDMVSYESLLYQEIYDAGWAFLDAEWLRRIEARRAAVR